MTVFCKAMPIWVKGKENEMHYRAQFKTVVSYNGNSFAKILIATSGIYNLFINGVFVAYGPARAGRGHFRIDNLDITDFLKKGKNAVVVEVCGYNATSFYLQKQSSFLSAEIYIDNSVVSFTGGNFTARKNPFYIQKSQRYSYQRPMVEAYNIKNGDTFLTDLLPGDEEIATVKGGEFIARFTEEPLYEYITAKAIERGNVGFKADASITYNRSLLKVGEDLSGFTVDELEAFPTSECEGLEFTACNDSDNKTNDSYTLYSLPFCASGMLDIKINCLKDTTLYILFDEILTDGGVDFLRGECANVIKYILPKGEHSLKLFEVYTMKYIQAVTLGESEIKSVAMIEYKHPPVAYDTTAFKGKLKAIADAAIETFRQNSVDLFSDCPSRERAGWLCDSYFTSQVEALLCGNNKTEKSFLENFLHEDNYIDLPDGMVPMCYPSDVLFGEFIPQWSLWLLLELEKYYERTGDRELIDRFKVKTEKLLSYFSAFENEDGLLEGLDGWQFVEWSKANELVNDVNYPTNMLYIGALRAVAVLYNKTDLYQKAEKIANTVLKQSFNGEFFCDNAVREDGSLVLSGERTEVCQYYAFFFDIANSKTHPALLKTLIESFGPQRPKTGAYPEIYPANAFIGNYLRLDILMRYGEYEKALENITDYFYYMAKATGTLWEHTGATASCDHGFASYVICWLDELKKKGLV